MSVTKRETTHCCSYKTATVPAGTKVIEATNLPQGGYWVEPWPNMPTWVESWQRNYGFHVNANDVTR